MYNKDYTKAEDAEYRITTKDIQDNYDFEEYLSDYHEIEYSGFCDFTPIEDEDCVEEPLTIRRLYELAKEKDMLDKPLLITYYCNDSWYTIENKPLTEDDIGYLDDAIVAEIQ